MSELRPKIIFAIERGNTQASPFLHVTSQVETCVGIWQERRYLYQPVMVRFPKNAVPDDATFSFEQGERGHPLLNDQTGDSLEIVDALMKCRAYVQKDKEAVLLKRPSYGVEWFDVKENIWKVLQAPAAGQWFDVNAPAAPSQGGRRPARRGRR